MPDDIDDTSDAADDSDDTESSPRTAAKRPTKTSAKKTASKTSKAKTSTTSAAKRPVTTAAKSASKDKSASRSKSASKKSSADETSEEDVDEASDEDVDDSLADDTGDEDAADEEAVDDTSDADSADDAADEDVINDSTDDTSPTTSAKRPVKTASKTKKKSSKTKKTSRTSSAARPTKSASKAKSSATPTSADEASATSSADEASATTQADETTPTSSATSADTSSATSSAATPEKTSKDDGADDTDAKKNSGNASAEVDLRKSLVLDSTAIQTGYLSDGQDPPVAGERPSLTSSNNFINFCANLPLTNGRQVTTGSCNSAPMGMIPSTFKMPSAKFLLPKNLDTVPFNQTFTIELALNNLDVRGVLLSPLKFTSPEYSCPYSTYSSPTQAGFFTNADKSYFSAPQQLNPSGTILGHTHVVIEAIDSLTTTILTDPSAFFFFKGINTPLVDGKVSTEVTGGCPPGFYRLCSQNAAMNHQPVVVPIAQHGSLDDCIYVSDFLRFWALEGRLIGWLFDERSSLQRKPPSGMSEMVSTLVRVVSHIDTHHGPLRIL
ncbi:hypothetical protein C8R43DRAFT_589829 [Mycena crocata]|nr:hypothetical protein C8R43DRAFT_589829 [Mycena crocata]